MFFKRHYGWLIRPKTIVPFLPELAYGFYIAREAVEARGSSFGRGSVVACGSCGRGVDIVRCVDGVYPWRSRGAGVVGGGVDCRCSHSGGGRWGIWGRWRSVCGAVDTNYEIGSGV